MGWKVVKLDDRLYRRRIAVFSLILSLFALSLFAVVSSVALNVYLHELGHYSVAALYDLNPEMHISNVVEMDSEGIRMNMNPEAYVRYKDPGDTWKNIHITIAGPLVNLILFVVFVLFQVYIHNRLSRKADKARRRGLRKQELRYSRICLIADIVLLSMAVPSLLSVIMNMLDTPGSDGAFLRELFREL